MFEEVAGRLATKHPRPHTHPPSTLMPPPAPALSSLPTSSQKRSHPSSPLSSSSSWRQPKHKASVYVWTSLPPSPKKDNPPPGPAPVAPSSKAYRKGGREVRLPSEH